MPEDYVAGVATGIADVMSAGGRAGFPVVDVRATLTDGAYHGVHSSVLAFETASRMAFRDAMRDGGSVLLEPIMRVDVTTPEEDAGAVIGDLRSRRGRVRGREIRGGAVVIAAMVPLATMIGYVDDLRSLGEGRADAAMRFSHYQPVPTSSDDGGGPPPAIATAMRP